MPRLLAMDECGNKSRGAGRDSAGNYFDRWLNPSQREPDGQWVDSSSEKAKPFEGRLKESAEDKVERYHGLARGAP